MPVHLNVLLVEDSEEDAEMIVQALRSGGYEIHSQRVESAAQMTAALARQAWDVLISDYSLPQFNGRAALELLKNSGLDLPFLAVSGTCGEEVAVEMMKSGAHDYLMKDNLKRLVPAVQRELFQAEVRRGRKQDEEALRRTAERLRILHAIDQAILQAAESPESIVRTALGHLQELLRSPRVGIGLFSAGKRELQVFSAGAQGLSIEQKTIELPAGAEGSLDFLRRDGTEIGNNSPGAGSCSSLSELIQPDRENSGIEIPLLSAQELYGILHIGWEGARAVTPEETEIAGEVASQITIAIEQARLLQETKRHASELEQLVAERTAELRTANEELKEAQVAADLANKAKSDFLANMSHELRTPLSAILGFTQMLQEKYFGSLTEKQEEYLADISDSSYHLLALINDILDLAKIEAGRMELEPGKVHLSSFIRNTLNIVKEKALKNRVLLQAHLPAEHEDSLFVADERKMKQIVYNLLSNAVKFTPPEGAIRVKVEFVPEDDRSPGGFPTAGGGPEPFPLKKAPAGERRWLRIVVEDTGIGVPLELQGQLFEPFYQVQSGSAGKTPGTGLGLHLTRRLVELHGGHIRLESQGAGKGSCFIVEIPWQPAPAETAV